MLFMDSNNIVKELTKYKKGMHIYGWGTRIRTLEWRNQNPLPYRLAIPHYKKYMVRVVRFELAHLSELESESSASTNSAIPVLNY